MKCSVYIATSADGFIARKNGDIDWLLREEYADASEVGLVYDTFISDVDAIVMGRNTYEKVLSFATWHYEGIPVVVLSTRGIDIPEGLERGVRVLSGDPEQIVKQLQTEGYKQLYIDGGQTIQRFLDRGLIDEITITVLPLILGDGIPLFGAGRNEQILDLMELHRADSGTVQFRYRVLKNSSRI